MLVGGDTQTTFPSSRGSREGSQWGRDTWRGQEDLGRPHLRPGSRCPRLRRIQTSENVPPLPGGVETQTSNPGPTGSVQPGQCSPDVPHRDGPGTRIRECKKAPAQQGGTGECAWTVREVGGPSGAQGGPPGPPLTPEEVDLCSTVLGAGRWASRRQTCPQGGGQSCFRPSGPQIKSKNLEL